MTTSVLHHAIGEINEFDLQVLRDYAVEAPPEWRNLLERLIAAQERDWVERDFQKKYDGLRLTQDEASRKMTELLIELNHLWVKFSDAKEALSKGVQSPELDAWTGRVEKMLELAEAAFSSLKPEAEKKKEAP